MKHVNIRLPNADETRQKSYVAMMWGMVGATIAYVQASPRNAELLRSIDPPLEGLNVKESNVQGDELLTCIIGKEDNDDDV